ncbi:tetratricopeptide repeat protein, partial [bacterium]|nr:tetratricopeptide repeat protein [bacterium]
MRKNIIMALILLSAAGCSERIVSSSAEKDRRPDNRYDYILSEALRQKYVGDAGEAATLFEKCIELDRTRAVPYFELAQMYSSAGMSGKSMYYASRAARLEPGNYWYQLAAGSLFTQYELKDSALVYFKRALDADHKAVEINGILAGLYSEKGDAVRADSLFRVLDTEGVLTPDMSLMMISGLLGRGEYDEAARRTIKLLSQYPDETRFRALLADIYFEQGLKVKSDSIYTGMIERNPDDIETQLLYMLSLVYRKEYSGIPAFLNNVFRSDVVEREQKIAVAQRLAGDSAYIVNNAESLIGSLVILEENYRGDEEIMSLRPGVYEAAGMTDLAIKRYEEILSDGRPGFWFQERLMVLYAEKKDYRKLYNLASGYSRDNNRSILGKVYYALAAMELKEYEVADGELKKALILAGNNDQLKVQVMSMMGDLKYRMKDYEASYSYYEQALKISPDDPLLLNNYAYFLAEGDRDLKKALKMAERVMETDGDNPTYMDTYAWVFYKMGKYREAHRVMLRIFENSDEKD